MLKIHLTLIRELIRQAEAIKVQDCKFGLDFLVFFWSCEVRFEFFSHSEL